MKLTVARHLNVNVFGHFNSSPGKLNPEQLCRAMEDLHLPSAKADLEAFMHVLDANGDGRISKNEFMKYCFTIRTQRRFRNRRRTISGSTTSKRCAPASAGDSALCFVVCIFYRLSHLLSGECRDSFNDLFEYLVVQASLQKSC